MNILIVGSGIAGLTLAYWLQRLGQQAVVIEQAPQLRNEGFLIDFFGSGYTVAERMHLIEALSAIHHTTPRMALVDEWGHQQFSVDDTVFYSLLNGRFFNLMHGEFVHLLYTMIKDIVPVKFGLSVSALKQDGECVNVTLSDGTSHTFDLVVGADGIHSHVRRLVFGPEEQFCRFLGYYTAAFVTKEVKLPRDAFYSLAVPRRQIVIHPIRDNQFAVFFLHRAPYQLNSLSHETIHYELKKQYGDLGWIVPELLTQSHQADQLYFDALVQAVLPRWSQERVVLVGDACQSVSPIAGQGASLAMAGAYVLAHELATASPSMVSQALMRYEQRMKPVVERKQKIARRSARWFFAPENHFYLAMRQFSFRMMGLPMVKPFMKRSFAWDDGIKL